MLKEHLFNKIDILIVPTVLVIILIYVYNIKKKQPASIQKYFMPAFYLHTIGTILISAVTEFYYKGGDTFQYYFNAQALRIFFVENPKEWLFVFFSNPSSGGEAVANYLNLVGGYNSYSAAMFNDNQSATVGKVASLFNLILFDSYLAIALIFSLLSFLGCWHIFKTFVQLISQSEKFMALFSLFLPSLWFWGSGVLKDPLCLFAVGLIVSNLFLKNNKIISRIFFVALGIIILLNVKPYIFYALVMAIIAASIYLLLRNSNSLIKFIFFVVLFCFVGIYSNQIFEIIFNAVSQILIESQIASNSYNTEYESSGGTFLPTIDNSISGFVKLALDGIINVFFRPFPWEMKNFFSLFVVLENLFLIFILLTPSPKIFFPLKKNALFLIAFSILFSLILAVIIGVTTFNLGTIVRYRLPLLPFIFSGIYSLKVARKQISLK